MPDPDDRSWIVPGAEVVVYSTGRTASARLTTVLKVATQSFTVPDAVEPLRINLRTLESKVFGSSWSSWYYAAVKADSDKARQLLEAERARQLCDAAWLAAIDWNRGGSKDPAKVDAVIAAFTAYRETLLPTDTTGATA